MAQPFIWKDWALHAAGAEAGAKKSKQERDERKSKLRG